MRIKYNSLCVCVCVCVCLTVMQGKIYLYTCFLLELTYTNKSSMLQIEKKNSDSCLQIFPKQIPQIQLAGFSVK